MFLNVTQLARKRGGKTAQNSRNSFGASLSRKPPKTTQNHPHRSPETVSALPYPKNNLKPLKTTQ